MTSTFGSDDALRSLRATDYVSPTETLSFGSESASSAQVSAVSPPVCVPVPAGAIAWWRAEGNHFDSIGSNDLVGQSRTGIGLYFPGKVGNAFSVGPLYRVYPNLLYAPPSTNLDVGTFDGFSFECWIWPDIFHSQRAVEPVIEWRDTAGNIGVGLNLNGQFLEANLADTSVTPTRRILLRSALGVVKTLAWQHVALTFSRTSGLATIYLDATPVAQTNLGSFFAQTKSPVYIGYGRYSSLRGLLDELTIYNRELSPEEITSIVNADSAGKCPPPPRPCAPPPSALVGWWRGESNMLDSVDSNDAFRVGSVVYSGGIVDQAFQFVSGYIRVPASTNLNVGAGPGLTIESWISPDLSHYGLLARPHEFVGWHSGVTNQGVSLSFNSVWVANLVDIEGRSHVFRSPEGLATQDFWQHVAVTYEKGTGDAVLYFNGVPVTQTNLGSFIPNTTGELNFGYQSQSLPDYGISSGAMDEVSLYSRALCASEVQAVMNSRTTGKCKDPPLITMQPLNMRVNEGGNASLTVTATGNPLLKYQWSHDGTNLAAAVNRSLSFTNVQFAQSGEYSVRITNAFGVAVSSSAVLMVNRAPSADATATLSILIAPIDCNPLVVLNGSRSSDPDGDSLQFNWFKAGESYAFATGMVAVVTLPVGTNVLNLVVDDGLATNAQDLVVEIITPAQALERLILLVRSEASKPQPLTVCLLQAVASLARGNVTSAMNQLGAFQNQVRAQVAPEEPAMADRFAHDSQEIVDILAKGCSPTKPRTKIEKISSSDDGRINLHFSAPKHFVYLIEASRDLINWQKIGVAWEAAAGDFEFEDSSGFSVPNRFYRVVVVQ